MDLSKADTIISAFLTGFFAAQIIISAAEKTAGAVPAGLFLNHQPTTGQLATLIQARIAGLIDFAHPLR